MSLLARLGGIGLRSHFQCTPLAYSSALNTSDLLLNSIYSVHRSKMGAQKIERGRRGAMMEGHYPAFLGHGQKADGSSRLTFGQEADVSIPTSDPSDTPTSISLPASTREYSAFSPSQPACRHCGDAAPFDHDEDFTKRSRWTAARHESVIRAIEEGLSTLDSTRVEVEPSTLEGRRNDLRVHESVTTRPTTIDYDVKVISLVSHIAQSTTTRALIGTSLSEHVQSQANRYLEAVAKGTDNRRPWTIRNSGRWCSP